VWNDLNANGLQDSGEPGYAGVVISLVSASSGSVLATTTSASDGSYLFSNVGSGVFQLTFQIPAQLVTFTSGLVGSDNTVDSDVVSFSRTTGFGATANITVVATDLTIDCGVFGWNSIGDYVWSDDNADGLQQPFEFGILGQTVQLLDSSLNVLQTATTDNTGTYLFSFLLPAVYYVRVNVSSSYTFTTSYVNGASFQGNSRVATSHVTQSWTTGTTAAIDLSVSTGVVDIGEDFGLFLWSDIGDFVWNDLNANGIQEAGEPGVAGVTVVLADQNGNTLAQSVTDANGMYHFMKLLGGNYQISVMVDPTVWTFSPANQGIDPNRDSNAVLLPLPGVGSTGVYALPYQTDDTEVDFGIYRLNCLGRLVWNDLNADGLHDVGEPGLANVNVSLYVGGQLQLNNGSESSFVGGSLLAQTVTNATGYYQFCQLPQGLYSVQVTIDATLYHFTAPLQGANTSQVIFWTPDSAPSGVLVGQSLQYELVDGQNVWMANAGVVAWSSVGDFVWDDQNADGVQNVGEPGLPNVTVELIDATLNHTFQVTTTDASGHYLFTHVQAGSYRVRITFDDTTYSLLTALAGPSRSLDSNFPGYPARVFQSTAPVFTIVPGQQELSIDGALHRWSSVGSYVWVDSNANAIHEMSEAGAAGILVQLSLATSPATFVALTLTDANGMYLFQFLQPGTYQVSFTVPSPTDNHFSALAQHDNAVASVQTVGSTLVGTTAPFALAAEGNNLLQNAGYYGLNCVGQRIFHDNNANGVFDLPSDTLFNPDSVVVSLYSVPAFTLVTQATITTGYFQFCSVQPGTYAVQFQVDSSRYFFTTCPGGSGSSAACQSHNGTVGFTGNFTLGTNSSYETADAGLVSYGTIGSLVWLDSMPADGLYQPTAEVGVSGVTVRLLNQGSLVASTVTDSNGNYLFTQLPPSTAYQVSVSVDATKYAFSQPNQDPQHYFDSKVVPTNTAGLAETAFFTLAPGQSLLTENAGLVPFGSIGSFVWIDNVQQNSQYDAGEQTPSSVQVLLLDASTTPSTVLQVTTTDATGHYLFSQLLAGLYQIEVTYDSAHFAACAPSVQNTVALSTSVAGQSEGYVVSLATGANVLSQNACLVPVGTLGHLVWQDTVPDCVQSGVNEPGIATILSLYHCTAGGVACTSSSYVGQTSSLSGQYQFVGQPQGYYFVRVALPSGFGVSCGANPGGQTPVMFLNGSIGVNNNFNIGLVHYTKIGSFVWEDLNRNGVQDAGEPGVANVTVQLVCNGVVSQQTVTNANGTYLFAQATLSGNCSVCFESAQNFTRPNAGSSALLDSDVVSVSSGKGCSAYLSSSLSSAALLHIDAGLLPLPETCNDYLGVDDKLWDYILLPYAVSDMIERLERTYSVLEWIQLNLPAYDQLPASIDANKIGAMAEINRMFLENCGLEQFCQLTDNFLQNLDAVIVKTN